MPSPQEILALVHKHAWWPLAALAIGLLVWAAKQSWFWGGPLRRLSLAGRARVVLALGILSGVLDAIARGTPWADAIGWGVVSALAAMGVHDAGGGLSGAGAKDVQSLADVVAKLQGLADSFRGPPRTVDTTIAIDGVPAPDVTPPPVVVPPAPGPQLDFGDKGSP